MKALLSVAPGGPGTLRVGDLPDPVQTDDELLIEVAACGLNFPDLLVIEDRYQFKPPRPFAPGSEVAGTVLKVGAAVTGWAPGDRLVGTMLGSGGLAQRAAIKASAAFHLPAEHNFVEGAALLLTYGTAIHALIDRGRLRAGETLLVLGAAGGVGLAAAEIGCILGARVIAAVSDEAKASAAREAGAAEVLIYPRAPEAGDERALAASFKELAGPAGANVILDPVGGAYAKAAMRAIAWDGRFLVVGFPAGIPEFPANLILLKSCSVIGVFQGAFGDRDPAANAANVQQLFDWWSEGRLRPAVTGIFALAEAPEALQMMAERRVVGKLVVDMAK